MQSTFNLGIAGEVLEVIKIHNCWLLVKEFILDNLTGPNPII